MSLPMIHGLEDSHYKADVIGGNASMCPALVGNPSLVNMRAVLASNWFDNKDGLLIIPDGNDDFHMIRLLLTDSRHYLLPLDEETSAAEEKETIKAKTFLTKVHEVSSNKWKDVRTWFSWTRDLKQKRSQFVEDEQPSPPTTTTAASTEIKEDPGLHDKASVSDQFTPPTTTAASSEIKEDPGATVSDAREHVCNQSQGTWATQVLTSEILASSQREKAFEMPMRYPGDQYPSYLAPDKTQKLNKQYQATHEEFYTKSGQVPVTPDNFGEWKQTKKARRSTQFWEICSGSGRLSYLALLAGLSVAFPVDYRYGWDIGNPEHQRMLLEMQNTCKPQMIMLSPSCGPWSTSANRLSPEDRQRLQTEERNTLVFVKKLAANQEEHGRGFVLENPWGSSLWKHSPLASLEHELANCRPKQRADQCAYGAVDETGKPIQKATGLQANFSIRSSTRRCRGHRQGHGVLQATFQGKNRTTLAAVYPHQFCRALIKDFKKFASKNVKSYFIGYKCQKCALGKDAPPGTEHTLRWFLENADMHPLYLLRRQHPPRTVRHP